MSVPRTVGEPIRAFDTIHEVWCSIPCPGAWIRIQDHNRYLAELGASTRPWVIDALYHDRCDTSMTRGYLTVDGKLYRIDDHLVLD